MTRSRFAWKIFYILIFIVFVDLVALYADLDLDSNVVFKLLLLGLPVLLLIIHSFQSLSFVRGLFFITLSCITGLIMEILGLRNGGIFGGHYFYEPNQLIIYNVPLYVVLYWAVFIYTGYCIANSFLVWLNREKPNLKNKNLILLLLLIIADALIVVAIDLVMDPIQVRAGSWTWLESGPYFGVPIGNFIGWFITAVIASGIFRMYEYFFPKKLKFDKSIYMISVLGYGVLGLSFALTALKYQMISLAIIGSLLMIPIVILNIFLHRKFQIIGSSPMVSKNRARKKVTEASPSPAAVKLRVE